MLRLLLTLTLLVKGASSFYPATSNVLLSDAAAAAKKPALFELSKNTMDNIQLPSVELPKIELPSVELPQVDVPQVNLDALKSFTVDVPQLDKSLVGDLDETILIPAAAAVGVFVILGALQNKSGDSFKRKKSLLAIPYDAAAELAYGEWLSQNPDQEYSDEGYAVFKERYEQATIAMVMAKKLQRDLNSFDNQAPPPKPKRTIQTKKKDQASPFFFAE